MALLRARALKRAAAVDECQIFRKNTLRTL
jgi:hypothetical protein